MVTLIMKMRIWMLGTNLDARDEFLVFCTCCLNRRQHLGARYSTWELIWIKNYLWATISTISTLHTKNFFDQTHLWLFSSHFCPSTDKHCPTTTMLILKKCHSSFGRCAKYGSKGNTENCFPQVKNLKSNKLRGLTMLWGTMHHHL